MYEYCFGLQQINNAWNVRMVEKIYANNFKGARNKYEIIIGKNKKITWDRWYWTVDNYILKIFYTSDINAFGKDHIIK